MTPGLRASSSLILKTIFIRSDPMSAIFVKMPPAMRSARGAQRFADRESDEAGARVVAGDEQQDEQHQQQLDADEHHADAHAGLERDRVAGIRLAAQAGERGPRVRRTCSRGCRTTRRRSCRAMPTRLKPRMMATFKAEKCCRSPSLRSDDDADEQLENQQELALLQQVHVLQVS